MSKTLDVTRHREAKHDLAGGMPSPRLLVIVTNSCPDFAVTTPCTRERVVNFDQAVQKSSVTEEKQQARRVSEIGLSN